MKVERLFKLKVISPTRTPRQYIRREMFMLNSMFKPIDYVYCLGGRIWCRVYQSKK